MRAALVVGVAALVVVACASAGGSRGQALHLVRVGSFDSPVYVTAPRTEPDKLYVVEQDGKIKVLAGGTVTTFLDITSQVLSGGERGLLSVAFNPNYAENRLFYIDYTARNGNTIIAEYRSGSGSGSGSGPPTRTRTLVNLPDPADNHNGGQLEFGPDGLLWWGNGDGGGGGDEFDNAQNLARPFAKIMRLNVANPKARWSVWAVGLRNPWRFSFDRANDDLYIADVGQGDWEEIDYVRKGTKPRLNFGWNRFEGRARYGDERLLGGWRYVPPVAVYSHGVGCSVTGGYVYRGKNVPAAVGRYFYGDYCSGNLWSMRIRNGKATSITRLPFKVAQLSSFGEDASGELYLVSQSGPVYRLAG